VFKLLFAGLSSALAPFLLRFAAIGGFVFFSEAIFKSYITKLQQLALNHLNAIPPEYHQFVLLTGIHDALSIVFSAYFTAIAIKAAQAIASAKASKYSQPWNGF
jgi:hypothetical protein